MKEASDGFNIERDFKYKLDGNNEVAVLVLIGTMFGRGMGPAETDFLQKMEEQLFKKFPHQLVVLDFYNVIGITAEGQTWLTKFQKTLRARERVGVVCRTRPNVRRVLTTAGILRAHDIFNSISDAWNTLKDKLPPRRETNPQK